VAKLVLGVTASPLPKHVHLPRQLLAVNVEELSRGLG
jgi:hypothetical protein